MPGMGASLRGAPGAQNTPEDEESAERVLRLRRNLKYYLAAARLGLNGPSDSQNGGIRLFAAKGNTDPKAVAGADDPDWKFVDNLFKAVQEQIKNLDKDEEYDKIAEAVVASRNKLSGLLKGGPSAPPPAATGPAKGARGGAAKK
jgi:hypothetical protein